MYFFVEFGAVFLAQAVNGMIKEIILAGPRAVVHAKQMQERRLPCSRRSHDGDEFPLFDIDGDAAKNEGLGGAVLEILFDVT
jgi:hypothetical protein